MPPDWMIYGANGYTGRRIAQEAVRRGRRPLLAGRSQASIEALAAELGCECRVFSLDDAADLAGHLRGLRLVVHCAGPFSATAAPMMDACLDVGAHYCDITGEIDVIEAGHDRHPRALATGVALMPAVGFDVVPTDCLAASLAARLPGATHLELAFAAGGGLSRGTAKTMVENLPRGGRVRRDGALARVPAAWKAREIPFRDGPRWAMTIPWGDVASAYYSTGIPNIEVYLATPRGAVRRLQWVRPLLRLTGLAPVQRMLKRSIDRGAPGPSESDLAASRCSLWGSVGDAAGRHVSGTLETPGGYPLTVQTTLAAAERILVGGVEPGFHTPSQAFGADFILSFPDTDMQIEGQRVPRPAAAPAP